jgi:hypothetical protein
MSDFISKMLNKSCYENNWLDQFDLSPLKKCEHKFSIENCTESGLAVCSKCKRDFNELRSE